MEHTQRTQHFISTVEVENDSNSDLVNVDLNLTVVAGSQIYIARGGIEGSANRLPFAEPYASEFHRLIASLPTAEEEPQIPALLFERRDFRVPVFNRRSKVKIELLSQANAGQRPTLHLSCDHPGVRVVFSRPRAMLLGVPVGQAALIGVIFGVFTVVALRPMQLNPTALALIAFALGAPAP
jgi:hypothetical protein